MLMIVLNIATPQKTYAGAVSYGCVAMSAITLGYSIKTFTNSITSGQGYTLRTMIKCRILGLASAGFLIGGIILA